STRRRRGWSRPASRTRRRAPPPGRRAAAATDGSHASFLFVDPHPVALVKSFTDFFDPLLTRLFGAFAGQPRADHGGHDRGGAGQKRAELGRVHITRVSPPTIDRPTSAQGSCRE